MESTQYVLSPLPFHPPGSSHEAIAYERYKTPTGKTLTLLILCVMVKKEVGILVLFQETKYALNLLVGD